MNHFQAITVDASNCDQELIHIPGFIQPHGMLFTLDEPNLTILQASDNLFAHFGRSARELNGVPLSEILDATSLGLLSEALKNGQVGTTALHVFSTTLNGDAFHALAHRHDGLLILELELAVREGVVSFQNLYTVVGAAVSRLERASDATELCRLAVCEIRQLTGFDKVMIYLFDEDYVGTVVAEDRAETMDAYLGLRFPASDIPRQARALYLLNKLRLISNVHATSIVIEPTANPLTKRSLDLSYATLRNVSPIHIEYLKNMGVGASMSVSIVRDGQLVGLAACHHQGVKYLSYEVRSACEFLGQVLALQLGTLERTASREKKLRLLNINALLLQSMTQTMDYVEGLASLEAELVQLTGATGAAISLEDRCLLLGQTPDEAEIQQIVGWLSAQQHEVISTDSLSLQLPVSSSFQSNICAVLAISISQMQGNFIVWFRPEIIQTIQWAGDPNKRVDIKTGFLHPRQSFEVWKHAVRGHSVAWEETEIEAATQLRAAIVGIVLRQAEERAALSTELLRSNRELEELYILEKLRATAWHQAAHDLRGGLFGVAMASQILNENDITEFDRLNTAILLQKGVSSLSEMLNNLVGLARLETGKEQRIIAPFDAAVLLKEFCLTLQPVAKTHGLFLRCEGPDSLPVEGDSAKVGRILQNLVLNALKYTEKGGVIVTWEYAEQTDTSRWLVSVQDTGPGFPADSSFPMAKQLVTAKREALDGENESRAHDTSSSYDEPSETPTSPERHSLSGQAGEGIGFSIVKGLCDLLDATLELETQSGQGSTFRVMFPKSYS